MISALPAPNLPANITITAQDISEDSESEIEIPGRSVHPAKLTAMLRSNFGVGAYNIMMARNVYTIRTPRRLSADEIARCR